MTADTASTSSGSTIGQRLAIVGALAAAVAMLAAVGFVGRVLLIRHVARDFANVSRDYLWMAPLGHAILFAVAAVPLFLLATVLSARHVTWLATWTFVCLAVFGTFMPITSIGRGAALVLAAGLGTMAARYMVGRVQWVPRVGAIVASVLAAGLVGAGLVIRDAAPVPSGAAAGPASPNVLLVILDTVRADALGLYGYARGTTPNLDAFARKGVVFDAAMSTAPWTLPSHASVFTGRYPASLVTDYKVPLDHRDSTLAEVLAGKGYATAGVVGNVWYTSWESGLQRGFASYFDYQRSFEQVIKTTHLGRTDMADALFRSRSGSDAWRAIGELGFQEVPRPQPAPNTAKYVTDRFLDWHADRESSRPWFAFLNYFDAHDPFLPEEPYRSRFATPGREPAPRDRYDAELAYLDAHLGRLFSELERRGELGKTLVIVTADHGEHFGERKLRGHFNSIYMPLLWVPLVMRFDGRLPAGARIAREVSLRDLSATVLDLTANEASLPGTSWARQLAPDSSRGSPVVSTLAVTRSESFRELANGMLSIVEGGWHYIVSGQKEHEELYRYRSDPTESRNLIGSDTGLVLAPRMRNRIYEELDADRAGSSRRQR